MGFFSQVIILFFAGIFSAWLYARKLRKRNRDWDQFLWMIWDFGMWAWGILVYLDIIPISALVNWIPWVNVANGKDWMWNSFQLLGAKVQIEYALLPAIMQQGMDTIAFLIFLCYPGMYHLGGEVGRTFYGRRIHEGGIWWALAPLKKPQQVKEAGKNTTQAKT